MVFLYHSALQIFFFNVIQPYFVEVKGVPIWLPYTLTKVDLFLAYQ